MHHMQVIYGIRRWVSNCPGRHWTRFERDAEQDSPLTTGDNKDSPASWAAGVMGHTPEVRSATVYSRPRAPVCPHIPSLGHRWARWCTSPPHLQAWLLASNEGQGSREWNYHWKARRIHLLILSPKCITSNQNARRPGFKIVKLTKFRRGLFVDRPPG